MDRDAVPGAPFGVREQCPAAAPDPWRGSGGLRETAGPRTGAAGRRCSRRDRQGFHERGRRAREPAPTPVAREPRSVGGSRGGDSAFPAGSGNCRRAAAGGCLDRQAAEGPFDECLRVHCPAPRLSPWGGIQRDALTSQVGNDCATASRKFLWRPFEIVIRVRRRPRTGLIRMKTAARATGDPEFATVDSPSSQAGDR